MEEVSVFINAAYIYIRMKMTEEVVMTQVVWVLSYVQERVAEAWKDNLLDELAKGESEVETVEQLFSKIRNNFGEMSEKERKIEQLRTIEQGGRMCNEYIVTPYKCLGKISDILHLNNENNQLERRAWPPQRCSFRCPVMDSSIPLE